MAEDIKTELAKMAKWAKVVDRTNAYYAAIVEAADLVNKGQVEKLEQEILARDKQCQQEANEVACWAARGLKQIESCHKAKAELEKFVEDIDKKPCPEELKIGLRSGFTLGASEVESVCRGYVVSAITYVQMIQRLGLLEKKQVTP